MWPLQACFVMLSALWDKQPLAGQTFPISIHERWRPCASARLHLFLCYYISACPLLYPPSYFTSVLSCACCMQPDLLPPVNSWTSQNGSVEQEIEIIWGRGRSDSNEDETTQKKPNQGKSVFGSVCWTVSGKMINHHFPPADFPPFI